MRKKDNSGESKQRPTVRGHGLGQKYYHQSPPADDPVPADDRPTIRQEPVKADREPEPVPAAAAAPEPEPVPAAAAAPEPEPVPAAAAVPESEALPESESPTAVPAAGAAKTRHRHMSAKTTRRVLAAVAIGAIVAAVATIFIAGGFDSDSDLATHQPGEPTAGRQAGETFLGASQGECLMWNAADGSDIGEIDCAEPHKFEVAAVVDLDDYPGAEFGPGAKFPDVLRFTELQEEHCNPAVADYLKSRFDPNGKYEVGSINPGQQNWDNGERTLLCGLKYVKPSGAFLPVTGPVSGQDQSKIWEPGTCFGISQSQATDMVDCAQAHAFEVAGIVDLSAQFPGGPPSTEDQEKYLNDACGKVVDEYLGSPDALKNKTLTAFLGEPLDPMSWLAGSRKVNCNVGKGNAEGFAPIVGSAKGDILIDGQPPVPPPPQPEGRALPTPLPGAAPIPTPPR